MSLTLKKEVLEKYKNPIFFETGTCYGGGVEVALSAGFERIISIELDDTLYANAVVKFEKEIKSGVVQLFHGESVKILKEILPLLDKPLTFWLDAHGGQEQTPLIKEITLIMWTYGGIGDNVFLIDDMRMLGKRRGWGKGIFLDDLKNHIFSMDKNIVLIFEDSKVAEKDIMAVKSS